MSGVFSFQQLQIREYMFVYIPKRRIYTTRVCPLTKVRMYLFVTIVLGGWYLVVCSLCLVKVISSLLMMVISYPSLCPLTTDNSLLQPSANTF